MTGPNGISWTTQDITGFDNSWYSVIHGQSAGNPTFVAVAGSGVGNRVMTGSEINRYGAGQCASPVVDRRRACRDTPLVN
jgi:hypothetical protein